MFRFAVRKNEEVCRRLMDRNGITAADLDLFVSHQANKRIIESAAQRLGVPPDKMVLNIGEYGNTTAATIPLALARRRPRRPSQEGRPRAAGVGRRRLHRRLGAACDGLIDA